MAKVKNITNNKQRQKDFDTTGSGFEFEDPLKDNYNELLVAIYKQAIEDIIYKNGVYAADARVFLKKNPYGLNVNFDGIIKRLRGKENEEN